VNRQAGRHPQRFPPLHGVIDPTGVCGPSISGGKALLAVQAKKTQANREVRELTLLFDITRVLDSAVDMSQVLSPVLKVMSSQMGMSRGTITMVDHEKVKIQIEAAYGLSDSEIRRGVYQMGEGATGTVVRTGRAVAIPRISEEPMFLNRTGARRPLRKKDTSFICVPIKQGRNVFGTLSADRLFEEDVSLDEDIRLLSTIASMIAQAVRLRQAFKAENQRLAEENMRLQDELEDRFRPSNIIGNSKPMQAVYDLIGQVSVSQTTVLITGESGTGKELVAHAIHYNSERNQKPFIRVNCAALPETVIESELFGHEKGAFTGAVAARKGRFDLAQGGTIFLDEVGDFSPTTQVKLLRVLQEKEYERVGGTTTHKANVRIIAATNRDLQQAIEQNLFRQDLFYRLNVFPIHLPPLCERRTDILLLANNFIEKYSKTNHKDIRRISTPAIDMLMTYHWPGNVRELENSIERAVLLSSDDVIHGHNLPPTLQTAEASGTTFKGTHQATMDNLERELLIDALKSSRGNRAHAARALGISERLMGLRVRKHNINSRRFRTLE
jgi:Nif-specific regulatory protein